MSDPTDDPTIAAEPAPPAEPDAEPEPQDEPVMIPLPSEIDFNNFQDLKKRFGTDEQVDKYLAILPKLSQLRKDDEAAQAAAEAKAEKARVAAEAKAEAARAAAEAKAEAAAKAANAPPPWAPKTFAEEEARKLAVLTSPEVKKAEALLKANGLNLKDLTLDLTVRH